MSPDFRSIRILAWLEAASFLALLGIAMPLKYGYGQPIAVRVLGPIHGLLFILFLAWIGMALLQGLIDRRAAIYSALGALLPFGPLLAEGALKDCEKKAQSTPDAIPAEEAP